MTPTETPEEIIDLLTGYSQIQKLGHSRDQLAVLAPTILEQLEKVFGLWEIDVSAYEISVIFSSARAWSVEVQAD